MANALADDRHDDQQGDDAGVGGQGGRIHEHPDRDEEQHREQVAERRDLGRGLVRQLRLRHEDAGHERPERQRQPEHGARDERRHEGRRDDRQQEQFTRAQAGDDGEHPRQEARADDVGEGQEDRGLHHGRRERHDHVTAGQRRERDDEHDRGDVLDDGPAHRRTTVRAVHLAAIDELLEDDDRRRQRQARPDDECLSKVGAEQDHHDGAADPG